MKKSKSVKPPVRLGIIGTGGMAAQHAAKFREIRACKIVAACDLDPDRVRTFAETHKIPQTFTDVNAMLASSEIDAVAIVTPDAFHTPIELASIAAGKHVLCEKPLALNFADARRMMLAAENAGVVNMVNLSYRDWPAIQAVAHLIAKGTIGEIRHVEASYLQAWLVSAAWGDWRTSPAWLWRLSKRHGSNGVLGDVGVHIVDFAMFPAGPISKVFCQLETFPKAPKNRIGEYVLDANDSAVMTVTFKNGALGTIHTTRWCGGHANRLFLKIAGTLGSVEIDSDRSVTSYRICVGKNLDTNTWVEAEAKPTPNNYQRFIRSIQSETPDLPSFRQGAEAQRVLDACLKSAALDQPVRIGK
jgi:predicted dehydrogenase